MRVRFEDMHYALVLRIFQRNSAQRTAHSAQRTAHSAQRNSATANSTT